MNLELQFLRAKKEDLKFIIELLIEDELGKSREKLNDNSLKNYLNAFNLIEKDENQSLMVVKNGSNEIVATCHLTTMPSLTYQGLTRLNIEAVRVSAKFRGKNIGTWMFQKIFEFGKEKGIVVFQLTTNKKRNKAKLFYEKLGFQATHEGMKLNFIN